MPKLASQSTAQSNSPGLIMLAMAISTNDTNTEQPRPDDFDGIFDVSSVRAQLASRIFKSMLVSKRP